MKPPNARRGRHRTATIRHRAGIDNDDGTRSAHQNIKTCAILEILNHYLWNTGDKQLFVFTIYANHKWPRGCGRCTKSVGDEATRGRLGVGTLNW